MIHHRRFARIRGSSRAMDNDAASLVQPGDDAIERLGGVGSCRALLDQPDGIERDILKSRVTAFLICAPVAGEQLPEMTKIRSTGFADIRGALPCRRLSVRQAATSAYSTPDEPSRNSGALRRAILVSRAPTWGSAASSTMSISNKWERSQAPRQERRRLRPQDEQALGQQGGRSTGSFARRYAGACPLRASESSDARSSSGDGRCDAPSRRHYGERTASQTASNAQASGADDDRDRGPSEHALRDIHHAAESFQSSARS